MVFVHKLLHGLMTFYGHRIYIYKSYFLVAINTLETKDNNTITINTVIYKSLKVGLALFICVNVSFCVVFV